ncbi:MAG: molecular chaperone DnaJ [Pseudomonadota bacterium]
MRKKQIKLAALLLLASIFANADEVKLEKGVGFNSINEALTFLKAKTTVTFNITKPDGWLIGNDTSPLAVWSFTPEGHYAHPAVVKRELKQNEDGGVYMKTTALCQAEKESCDRLIEEFEQLNKKMRKNVQEKLSK